MCMYTPSALVLLCDQGAYNKWHRQGRNGSSGSRGNSEGDAPLVASTGQHLGFMSSMSCAKKTIFERSALCYAGRVHTEALAAGVAVRMILHLWPVENQQALPSGSGVWQRRTGASIAYVILPPVHMCTDSA